MKKSLKIQTIFLLISGMICSVSCENNPPDVITADVSDISPLSARSGGEVTDNGGSAVTARGVCWDITPDPTVVSSNKTSDGTGTGIFTSELSGLSANATYYVRAYAVNSEGTSYGNQVSFNTLCQSATSTTDATSDLGSSSATLHGTVNPNGSLTAVTFEYGTTTEYGSISTATPGTVGAGCNTQDGSCDYPVTANIDGLTPGQTYHYRVKAVNCGGTSVGNDRTFTTACAAPSAATNPALPVGHTTATLNGVVNANGASTEVTFEYGATTSYGSTAEAIPGTVSGTGNTSVSANITGLVEGQIYHFRVRATNSEGTSYGTDQIFITIKDQVTDASGNIYNVIQIGTQFWMKENLKTTKFNDGADIPFETVLTVNETSAYYWWNNDINNKNPYGALYNGYAVRTGKLCPAGWHVPTEADFKTLVDFSGGESIAGGVLKEAGFEHWDNPNTGASDSYGFTALPGGILTLNLGSNGSLFIYCGSNGYYWTGSDEGEYNKYYLLLSYNSSAVYFRYSFPMLGMSVRCIAD